MGSDTIPLSQFGGNAEIKVRLERLGDVLERRDVFLPECILRDATRQEIVNLRQKNPIRPCITRADADGLLHAAAQ